MSDVNYFYTGIAAILFITVLGGIGVVSSFSPTLNEEVKISLQVSEENADFEFTAKTSRDKLFSENGSTINFSPVQGKASLAEQGFECEIKCKK